MASVTGNDPLVSIYIPTRNRLQLLQRALTSCLGQSLDRVEVVVVDDGSSDGTAEYLEAMRRKDLRLRIVRHETPTGASRARNEAIWNGTAEYAIGLDDDDYMLPKRVETLLSALKTRDVNLVSSQDVLALADTVRTTSKPRKITSRDLRYYNCLGTQVLSRRENFIRVGGFDEGLKAAEDYDLWLRLVDAYGPCHIVDDPKALQVRSLSHDRARISNSASRFDGYRAFMRKHEARLSLQERIIQEYLMFPTSKKLAAASALRACCESAAPRHVFRRVLGHWRAGVFEERA